MGHIKQIDFFGKTGFEIKFDPKTDTIKKTPYNTKPLEGYKPHDEKFPNCCKYHSEVLNYLDECFKDKKPESDYINLKEKIINQLSYTEYHILTQINNPEWYKDITDYIEYNFESFGLPATGLNEYYQCLFHFIEYITDENNSEWSLKKSEKREKLIKYIDSYFKPPNETNEANKSDFNILMETYKKWIKMFPFELSFFAKLKDYYTHTFPFLAEKFVTNKYTGISKAKLHTKTSLFDSLINITDNLLSNINGVSLYENGLISNINEIELELLNNSRKLKIKQGYKNTSPNEEHRFIKMIKNLKKN